MAEVITVSALNHYVKMLLDANDRLFDIALRGEIANFVQNARSGHCYFSLRDEASSVKAVMFRADARRLAFRPRPPPASSLPCLPAETRPVLFLPSRSSHLPRAPCPAGLPGQPVRRHPRRSRRPRAFRHCRIPPGSVWAAPHAWSGRTCQCGRRSLHSLPFPA